MDSRVWSQQLSYDDGFSSDFHGFSYDYIHRLRKREVGSSDFKTQTKNKTSLELMTFIFVVFSLGKKYAEKIMPFRVYFHFWTRLIYPSTINSAITVVSRLYALAR
jgi:hypothetical protein